MGRLTLSNGCVSGLSLSLRKEGLRDELIIVAVQCKRLVDRDASLITTALMSLSFMAVRCQRLIVHVTMFCDGSFGVAAVRCQLLLCASLCSCH